jgi:hypothetical protein
VINQTNQNFKWLDFFDINTPDEYKAKIDKYKNYYSNLIPCYIQNVSELIPELNIKININLTSSNKYLIASRVDNDDALHRGYIEDIQSHLDIESDVILNYKYGYMFDADNRILYSCSHVSNPFITRIELIDGQKHKTIMSFNHTKASLNAPVRQLENLNSWMIVVHKHNLSNRVSGRPLFFPRKVFDDFNIECLSARFNMDYVGMGKFFYRYIKQKLFRTRKTAF